MTKKSVSSVGRGDDDSVPSLDAQRSYYDERWSDDNTQSLIASELIRLGRIINALAMIPHAHPNAPPKSICDLGCGRGWLANELCKFGDVAGVDLSPEGVAVATARWPKVQFVSANLLSWRPERQFDLVVSSEVLEHIIDKAGFAATIDHITKPGGYLLVTTPNKRLKSAWDSAQAGNQPIEDWVSPTSLRALFTSTMDVIYQETFMFDYLYTGIFRYTSAPKLLRTLQSLNLLFLYNGLRATLGIGLYQLILARKRGPSTE